MTWTDFACYFLSRPEALDLLKPKIVKYAERLKHQEGVDLKVVTILFTFTNWSPSQQLDRVYLYDALSNK